MDTPDRRSFGDGRIIFRDPGDVRRSGCHYEGGSGELLAAKEIHADKYLAAVTKEISEMDGFVITAFLSSRRRQLERRAKVWPRQK